MTCIASVALGMTVLVCRSARLSCSLQLQHVVLYLHQWSLAQAQAAASVVAVKDTLQHKGQEVVKGHATVCCSSALQPTLALCNKLRLMPSA